MGEKMTNLASGWHVGRKNMLSFLGPFRGWGTWRTVQKKIKSGELIVHRTSEGKPFIIESEVKSQLLGQSEEVLKKFHP
jgi:hypothetical protein